jgi:hypothetical protein
MGPAQVGGPGSGLQVGSAAEAGGNVSGTVANRAVASGPESPTVIDMSDKPNPEQARSIGRALLAMAETLRAAGVESEARLAEKRAEALLTGAPSPIEPELAALLRIEDAQKALRVELAAMLECLQRIEALLAKSMEGRG